MNPEMRDFRSVKKKGFYREDAISNVPSAILPDDD